MRREPTGSEGRLWTWLRDRRFSGYKFRKQYPIGKYILDFYCAELRLAIEVDGQHHLSTWVSEYDDQRYLELRARGIEVLQIPNILLIRDPRCVAECIQAAIDRIIAAR
jgi:very-short-patch-repair endonuclease